MSIADIMDDRVRVHRSGHARKGLRQRGLDVAQKLAQTGLVVHAKVLQELAAGAVPFVSCIEYAPVIHVQAAQVD